MDKSDYEVLDQTRTAAIRSAANLLEAADHAKRIRQRLFASTPRDDHPSGSGRTDLVYEVMRLNAHYLNRLADIGKKHSDVPHRVLERFYNMIVSGSGSRLSTELLFHDRRRVDAFEIYNDVDPGSATTKIEWTAPRPPIGVFGEKPWWSRIARETVPRPDMTVEVDYRYRVTSLIEVKVRDEFMKKACDARLRSKAELIVHEGKLRRRIPVVIDGRHRP